MNMHKYLLYYGYMHIYICTYTHIKPTESVQLCSYVYVSSDGRLALGNLHGRRLILPLSTVIGPM